MLNRKRSNLLYDLLTAPRYRIYRHGLLIVGMGLVGLNQAYMVYERFTFLFLWVAAAYLAAVYVNLYILIKRFLFTGKYVKYVIGVVLSTVFLDLVLDLIEYIMVQGMEGGRGPYYVLNSVHSWGMDLLFTFPQLVICIAGGAFVSMLREWRMENKRLTYLRNEYLETELEQLKDRISPDFLFKILHTAGSLSKEKPEQSSRLLVGLSRVLRYQLYDCAKDEVLLVSEQEFIGRYLELYRMYKDSFAYKITVCGSPDRIFIPPLLFLPLIQLMIRKSAHPLFLHVDFVITEKEIGFIGTVETTDFEDGNERDLADTRRRLQFLYANNFELSLSHKRIVLQLKKTANAIE